MFLLGKCSFTAEMELITCRAVATALKWQKFSPFRIAFGSVENCSMYNVLFVTGTHSRDGAGKTEPQCLYFQMCPVDGVSVTADVLNPSQILFFLSTVSQL